MVCAEPHPSSDAAAYSRMRMPMRSMRMGRSRHQYAPRSAGRRARLPPLSGRQRSQLAEASDASRQREAANVAERHRVFVASS